MRVVIVSVAASAFWAFGQTDLSASAEALAERPPVDKTWLRETLQPILAFLAIFVMLVLGAMLMRSTRQMGQEDVLAKEHEKRSRFWRVTRKLGVDFWVLAGIVAILVAIRFSAVLFLSLLTVYAAAKIAYVLLRERMIYAEIEDKEQARKDADEAKHDEIEGFFEQIKHGPVKKSQRKPEKKPRVRVETPGRSRLESEKFLTECIERNCYFLSLPPARRKPLVQELIRKLHVRWKEFDVRKDSVFLNRQVETGGFDQVCILSLHRNQDQFHFVRINVGFLQWALGHMVSKNDIVYETEDSYHAPDETERAQIALLPEYRRPNLIPVRDVVNPWHAMVGSRR